MYWSDVQTATLNRACLNGEDAEVLISVPSEHVGKRTKATLIPISFLIWSFLLFFTLKYEIIRRIAGYLFAKTK